MLGRHIHPMVPGRHAREVCTPPMVPGRHAGCMYPSYCTGRHAGCVCTSPTVPGRHAWCGILSYCTREACLVCYSPCSERATRRVLSSFFCSERDNEARTIPPPSLFIWESCPKDTPSLAQFVS